MKSMKRVLVWCDWYLKVARCAIIAGQEGNGHSKRLKIPAKKSACHRKFQNAQLHAVLLLYYYSITIEASI